MELGLSDTDAKAIGIDSPKKERLVDLVHRHLGRASVAFVKVVDNPPGIKLETANGAIIVDRDLSKRIDN